jgi:hypothetical protein
MALAKRNAATSFRRPLHASDVERAHLSIAPTLPWRLGDASQD